MAFLKMDRLCKKHGVDLGAGYKTCFVFVDYIAQSMRESRNAVLAKAK